MQRKMASIHVIAAVEPIEGADKICIYTVGGWGVVDVVGKYKVNEKVIFCEIDSFIPNEIAPFLTPEGKEPKEYNGIKGERLRTKKLKGVISQGLLLPLSTLDSVESKLMEGLDVSVPLGVVKWEPPAEFQSADTKGLFPSFIPKTDQERIQNLSKDFQKWKDQNTAWEVTEKLDGSSMTVFYFDGEVGVCSRNLELKEDENNTFWKAAKSSGTTAVLKSKGLNVAIQGELIGPGIQGNKYGMREHTFFVYDIFNIDEQRYFLPDERQSFCKEAFLNHVPVLDSVLLKDESIDRILKNAEGKSVVGAGPEREGLVFKNLATDESFKAISNKWLCKFE